jgi:hypothetical protein
MTSTSHNLSKKLHKNGCRLHYMPHYVDGCYPYYDILNEVCVKYRRYFFGKYWRVTTKKILQLLQMGDEEGAEKYIWEHCLYNPKNNHTQ